MIAELKDCKACSSQETSPRFVTAGNCEQPLRISEKSVWDASLGHLPSGRDMPKKRTFLGGNRSSQLLEWAEKLGVSVCNYLPGLEVYISTRAACVVPRPGLVSSQQHWGSRDVPGVLVTHLLKESKSTGRLRLCWGVKKLGLWVGMDFEKEEF